MFEGKRALILEDEPIIGFALEDMLEEIGVSSVRVATRIEEAERVLESEKIDLAVLDVNIHGRRSYPVADRLTERCLPFVFATGYGDTEHPDRYRAVPTVTKPYSLDAIKTALCLIAVAD